MEYAFVGRLKNGCTVHAVGDGPDKSLVIADVLDMLHRGLQVERLPRQEANNLIAGCSMCPRGPFPKEAGETMCGLEFESLVATVFAQRKEPPK